MEQLFQQALAAMPVADVGFILSHLPTAILAQPDLYSQDHAPVLENIPEEDEEGRRRRHIEREWPAIGTVLTADYYGTHYTAEIVPATKRLKSGKQIRITSGPAQGTVCDSFSETMITATDKQRTDQNLARKGVSNGWQFWLWEGKTEDDQDENDDVLQHG